MWFSTILQNTDSLILCVKSCSQCKPRNWHSTYSIKGYAELLLDGAIDDKSVAMEFLKEINVAADRMKILRDDLLDLSRFDTKVNKLNKEDVNLVNLVAGCCRQNLIVAENKSQSIVFNPPEKPMYIYGDPSRINQVITNIMSNAMKYSDEGNIQ